MTASEMLAGAWSRFRPVDLAELDAAAALAHRTDTKYLVRATVLAEVLMQLQPTHACLTIDGRQSFQYTTSYVDSPELTCYHDHRRGVRRRWKARTRVYEDSGQARWEVKLKDGRGMTVKHALPLPAAVDGHLTQQMRSFLDEVRDVTRVVVRYRRLDGAPVGDFAADLTDAGDSPEMERVL